MLTHTYTHICIYLCIFTKYHEFTLLSQILIQDYRFILVFPLSLFVTSPTVRNPAFIIYNLLTYLLNSSVHIQCFGIANHTLESNPFKNQVTTFMYTFFFCLSLSISNQDTLFPQLLRLFLFFPTFYSVVMLFIYNTAKFILFALHLRLTPYPSWFQLFVCFLGT